MTSPSDFGIGFGGMPAGGGPFGGPSHDSDNVDGELITADGGTIGPPFLVSSNPANGQTGVASSSPVSFVLGSDGGVDPSTISVVLDGLTCITNSVFLPGYAGSIVSSGGNVTVTISTHPPFVNKNVTCVIHASTL